MFLALAPQKAPSGWSPGNVNPATSTRAGGLIPGGFDVLRGVPERAVGEPLTTAQVTTLAPFLAKRTGVDAAEAVEELRNTRVVVGGLAKGASNVATTIGRTIYVNDAQDATRMLSWAGRGWLAHELTHTLQASRLGRGDSGFLRSYLGAYITHDGKPGGFWNAAAEALRQLRNHQPMQNAGTIIHGAHPMEREAAKVAAAFLAATAA